jgi:hypothetical protein
MKSNQTAEARKTWRPCGRATSNARATTLMPQPIRTNNRATPIARRKSVPPFVRRRPARLWALRRPWPRRRRRRRCALTRCTNSARYRGARFTRLARSRGARRPAACARQRRRRRRVPAQVMIGDIVAVCVTEAESMAAAYIPQPAICARGSPSRLREFIPS